MRRKTLYIGGPVLVIALAVGLAVRLGLVPVNADATPSYLERLMLPMVLRASVARQASKIRQSRPLPDADAAAGREIYSSLCSECHGRLDGRAGVLGLSFYPQAPQFAEHRVSYTDPETFWLVKHGIRNTGMPAWGARLSDEDIWNVVSFIKKFPGQDRPAPIE